MTVIPQFKYAVRVSVVALNNSEMDKRIVSHFPVFDRYDIHWKIGVNRFSRSC